MRVASRLGRSIVECFERSACRAANPMTTQIRATDFGPTLAAAAEHKARATAGARVTVNLLGRSDVTTVAAGQLGMFGLT